MHLSLHCDKKIFKDLSHSELLKKSVHGNTQNSYESVNNVILSDITKNTFMKIETLSFGSYHAVPSLNKEITNNK